MARELFCRHEDCGFSVFVIAGMLPLVCKGCGRTGRWNTEPVVPRTRDPQRPFEVNHNDRRFLRGIKIDPE